MAATVQLDVRAAVHAALGDPVRLRIADRLVLGDVAPGVLADELGIGSNLLAHHLNVLSSAGVVRRMRSEGDRRRSYVRLALDEPVVVALATAGAIGTGPVGPADRVVFVCTHNSARSHLAAAAWEQVSGVPVASAGTLPAACVHPCAVAVGARHDLDLSHRRTAHVDDVVRAGDLVVAVCDSAAESLAGSGTQPRLHWSVPDPVRVGTDDAFEAALEQLTTRVDRLGHALAAPGGDPT